MTEKLSDKLDRMVLKCIFLNVERMKWERLNRRVYKSAVDSRRVTSGPCTKSLT